MIIPPWEMDEEMKHAALRDATTWYTANGMPWQARAAIKKHDREYGKYTDCKYCREVHESFLETAYKVDSTPLFDLDDKVLPNPVGQTTHNHPLVVTLPFGHYVALEALPEHVRLAVVQKANEQNAV